VIFADKTGLHWQAEKIRWLQDAGMKRPLPIWRKFFGKVRLNERCIVAMVGDGINDAPVESNEIPLHLMGQSER
jgi:hypothetical protein